MADAKPGPYPPPPDYTAANVPTSSAEAGPSTAAVAPAAPVESGKATPAQATNPATQAYYVMAPMPTVYNVVAVPGDMPMQMWCPFDNKEVRTIVKHRPGLAAGCFSAILCFVCCPLFWIPLVGGCCDDAIHYCPECGRALAVVDG